MWQFKSTAGSALRLKRTIRCNNCKSKATVEKNLKHNHANRNNQTPTYISWASMMTRCYNENRKQYLDYGGRGIKVHNKWHEFINFLKDMGERPNGTTIDRINVNGNYEPNNCRWSDRKIQNNNKRNKKWW